MKNFIKKISTMVTGCGNKVPDELISLSARLAIATVFWKSAQTKISGWSFLEQSWQFFNLNQTTFFLFKHEYKVPLLPSDMAAYMAKSAEFFLSLAIALGLFTRLSALGLLAMTMVIQIFVYPNAWSVHILWAVALLYLFKQGGGKLSVDYLYLKGANN